MNFYNSGSLYVGNATLEVEMLTNVGFLDVDSGSVIM